MEARLTRLEEAVSELAHNLVKLTEVQVTQAHHNGILDRIVAELAETRRDINGVGGRVSVIESRQQQIALDIDNVRKKLEGENGLVARVAWTSGKIENHVWALRLIAGTLATLLGAIAVWVVKGTGGGGAP